MSKRKREDNIINPVQSTHTSEDASISQANMSKLPLKSLFQPKTSSDTFSFNHIAPEPISSLHNTNESKSSGISFLSLSYNTASSTAFITIYFISSSSSTSSTIKASSMSSTIKASSTSSTIKAFSTSIFLNSAHSTIGTITSCSISSACNTSGTIKIEFISLASSTSGTIISAHSTASTNTGCFIS